MKITLEFLGWQIVNMIERQVRQDYSTIAHGKEVSVATIKPNDKIQVILETPPPGFDPRD